jgi:uncharacterized phiE125 gp8 family phage protein
MPNILLAAPAAEPLTLAEAKAYLRVEHADDDALIAALIAGARGHVEARTRRGLITQGWRIVRDGWPADGRVAAPLAPLRQVTAARVYDPDGLAHALDLQAFIVEPETIAVVPWSIAQPGRIAAGIEIDVTVGYGPAAADIPEPLRQAVRLLLAHWYENRGVVARETAPLPSTVDALLAPYRVLAL